MERHFNPIPIPELLGFRRNNRVKRGRVKESVVRPFFEGIDAPLDPFALELLKRVLRFKQSRAKRKNPAIQDFTKTEWRGITKGFKWLVQRAEPKMGPWEIEEVVGKNLQRARKITFKDIQDFLKQTPRLDATARENLFGRVSMLLTTLSPQRNGRIGSLTGTLAYAYPHETIFSPMKPELMEETAVHELAHKRYNFNETLAQAAGAAYSYSKGTLKRGKIELTLDRKDDQRQGYLEGLKILSDSVNEARKNGGNWETIFWGKVKALARKKEYQLWVK